MAAAGRMTVLFLLGFSQTIESPEGPRACPKVFRYPDPCAVRWEGCKFRPSDPLDGRGPFGLPLGDELPGLFAMWHGAAPRLLEGALLTYGSMCSTDDPAKADLFCVPWWDWTCRRLDPRGKKGTCFFPEDEYLFEYLSKYTIEKYGVDYFGRNGGADHIVLWFNEALGKRVPRSFRFATGNFETTITAAIGGGTVIRVPFPSDAHYVPGVDPLPWSVKPAGQRTTLAALALGTLFQGQRRTVAATCEAAPNTTCQFLPTHRNVMLSPKSASAGKLQVHQELAALFSSAIFCVSPPGDTCLRKSPNDAMTMGCIPVVFQPCAVEAIREIMDVQKSMIVLSSEDSANYLEILQQIPESTIREMQVYIAQNAHRLQVSKMTKEEFLRLPPNATDMVEDDGFFHTFRLAHQVALHRQECVRMDGRFEAPFRVCCLKLPSECNPIAIVGAGVSNSCAHKLAPPCFFSGWYVSHLEEGMEETYPWGDYLRTPHSGPPKELPDGLGLF